KNTSNVMLLTHGSPPWNKGEQQSKRSTYNGFYSFFYKDINISMKRPRLRLFDLKKGGEGKQSKKMLYDRENHAITEAKSNSVHGSRQAM
ncbi:hypothetical protein Tco_0993918, partial [Tanacetum coccineum]